MSDIYIPGVRSRFNSERLVEDLMTIERIPRDRVQTNIENLQTQKSYWQEVGKRISSLREAANHLFSFQNPFNERIANSSDSSVLTALATREASEQTFNFSVKQTALADRFLSQPLNERDRIDAGVYIFSVGGEEISINFRGGTLSDFANIINTRGRDKIGASLISVQSGTRSLLIESKLTGAANRLEFAGDTVSLATRIGMMEQSAQGPLINVDVSSGAVRTSGQNASDVSVNAGVIQVAPLSTAVVPVNIPIAQDSPLILRLNTQTRVQTDLYSNIPPPPPGPSVPAGSVTYGGITIENEPSSSPLPEYVVPVPPARVDDMSVLNLVFSDGSAARLPVISDSSQFTARQYNLAEIARGRTLASINIENNNTHRDVSVGSIEIIDPTATGSGLKPVNAVSRARDAIITMEGIEIFRSSNSIDDLIPGVTLNVRGVSDKPVSLNIKADTESIKDAIFNFVYYYNRLMAEINVLTSTRGSSSPDLPRNQQIRGDQRLVDELTYLTREESEAMMERLGAFGSDTTLLTLKNNLSRIISAPYPTSAERDLSMLVQIGIGTNVTGSTGYDPSRLRGYLEINERTLDSALENRVPAIKELFAYDTTGDLLADTGIAYNIHSLVNPFVQTGGIITLKTNTIDSRISQDQNRITTLDRQLAQREQELTMQFARMEQAYARMESMSTSLNNFSQQNSNNR